MLDAGGQMTTEDTELRLAWEHALGRSRPARRVFEALVTRHREPHRRYHGVRHVVWVIRHVRELAGHEPVTDLDAVLVAACYHDAVYRAGRDGPAGTSDEEASANLARRELTGLADPAWPAGRIERVATMIRATEHLAERAGAPGHDPGHDTMVLLDADLAVLGAPPNAYQAYVSGVRAEYDHVDGDTWRRGRRAVLEALLDRPSIYRTATAGERWEVRARANLTAELAGLAG